MVWSTRLVMHRIPMLMGFDGRFQPPVISRELKAPFGSKM